MDRMGRGYSFEALRAKILFTEGIHSRKQARPKFERKRAPKPFEMGRAIPDEVMGYGLPVLEKVLPMNSPKVADQNKALPPPKNYGADISTLIRMIETGEL
jgi:transposase